MTFIGVVNKSTLVSDDDVKTMVSAVAYQLRHHVYPAWDLKRAAVAYLSSEADAPAGSYVIAILDGLNQANALGWHTEGPNGQVYGRVFAKPVLDNGGDALTKSLSIASVLSHEVIETYCLVPETKVLTADLNWVPIGDVCEGEALVGFDEEAPGQGNRRRYQRSVVERTRTITKPCIELILDDGTVVTCSEDHRWLVNNGGRSHWVAARDLIAAEPTPDARGRVRSTGRNASRVVKPLDVWQSTPDYHAGYLGGAFDGEGCLTQHTSSSGNVQTRLSIGQNDNAMQAKIEEELKAAGYRFSDTVRPAGEQYSTDHRVFYISHKRDVLRLLGEARPLRLLARLDLARLGSMVTDPLNAPRVLRKRSVGDREVIALQTTSRTFIAEGLASHNCDPKANLWADSGSFLVAMELCDPCEAQSYVVPGTAADGSLTDVTVSDFVYPTWFDPTVATASTHLHLIAPFTLLPGGYMIKMTEGVVSQKFARGYPAWRKTTKKTDLARTARRTAPRMDQTPPRTPRRKAPLRP